MNRAMRAHHLRHLVLCTVLAGCAARAPSTDSGSPPSPTLPAAQGLQVALAWSAPVDLDLYLTDPTWETAYFANTPSHTGARLLRDVRCRDIVASATAFVELASVTDPLPGHYRVGVDFSDACQASHGPVSFRVIATYGDIRHETTGIIRLEEFAPIVVEFELRRTGPDGALTLVVAPHAEL